LPSVSKAQARFFQWIEHDPTAAAKTGVPKAVAHEFAQADKGRSLKNLPDHKARGGTVKPAGSLSRGW
jgi:hypothetical protein